METLNLTKGQTVDLVKQDGSAISKIRAGLSWDVSGETMDLDLFVVAKEQKKVAYFGNKTAIKGIRLGEDNLTGAGEGDDEYADFNAIDSDDGTYVVCLNIYNAGSKNFSRVSNASVRIYNTETNEVLVEYKITENGGSYNGLIVGDIKDSGDKYTFTARGEYVNGDINQIAQSIF